MPVRAPGVQIVTAISAAKPCPQVMEDLATSLDEEVERMRKSWTLPTDISQWATFLTSRSLCGFKTFSESTPPSITQWRDMLMTLYPGDGDLVSRLQKTSDTAKEKATQLNNRWYQFKMLADGYLLHLETADRVALEDAFPRLEHEHNSIASRVTAVKARKAKWDRCFDLLLTETGEAGYMQTLQKRAAWTQQNFPGVVTGLVTELQQLIEERRVLVQETSRLWDEQFSTWFTRSGDRITPEEFVAALSRHVDAIQRLSEQSKTQKSLVSKLDMLVRFAGLNTTTLNRPGGSFIPLQDIRQSFREYEVIWIDACRITEDCVRLTSALERYIALLEDAHGKA
ncbi:hypothetical protein L227DRAFT_611284 [Lentinus tigrinus ALCF2SS1-6]|uniref:Uncharacterized protein n=1 Tax=Lentinus tigrinus ALCF2SS1-6 TaxID=1328759 RepID=A0A5C2S8Z4_9APHY|nr:hypothetical protein L227DRAFT_611284 [Lentinus tigrinus ALCF2SS1-6]